MMVDLDANEKTELRRTMRCCRPLLMMLMLMLMLK